MKHVAVNKLMKLLLHMTVLKEIPVIF